MSAHTIILPFTALLIPGTLPACSPPPGKILAKIVGETKASHPEMSSLEIAARRPGQKICKTVAATEED